MRSFIWIGILVIGLPGCARTERLPAYRWVDAPTALHHLASRAAAVKSASAECQITLTRPDGQSVRLDGALAMKPPDSVRLRAWKLGQAVFDLTVTPGGVWMVAPDDPDRRQRVLPAAANAAKMAQAFAMFSGEFFTAGDARIVDTGGPRFRIERSVGGQRIVCEVERSTLTPRRYVVSDSSGANHFSMTEDRYEIVSGIPWPTKLIARGENGMIEMELHDVELNAPLPPNAFVPPRRARKLE